MWAVPAVRRRVCAAATKRYVRDTKYKQKKRNKHGSLFYHSISVIICVLRFAVTGNLPARTLYFPPFATTDTRATCVARVVGRRIREQVLVMEIVENLREDFVELRRVSEKEDRPPLVVCQPLQQFLKILRMHRASGRPGKSSRRCPRPARSRSLLSRWRLILPSR